MRNDTVSFHHEFVALSKCLPTFVDLIQSEVELQPEIAKSREALALSIMTRMQALLDTADKPISWEEGVKQDVKEHNRNKFRGAVELELPPEYAMDPDTGERVPSSEQLDEAEQQLVQARLQDMIMRQIHDVTAEVSNGLMVERVYENGVGLIQAYLVPDPDQKDQKLNVYQFRLDLQDPTK